MLTNIATAAVVLLAWLWLCVVTAQPAIAIYLWASTPDPYIAETLAAYQALNTAPTDTHEENTRP